MALENTILKWSIVLDFSIAMPIDSINEPTFINGEKSSSKSCHLLRTNGISSHKRNLTSCPLHLGSTCTVHRYPITPSSLLTLGTLNQTAKTQFVVLHDGVSAVRQLREGRGHSALLYLKHQCLH